MDTSAHPPGLKKKRSKRKAEAAEPTPPPTGKRAKAEASSASAPSSSSSAPAPAARNERKPQRKAPSPPAAAVEVAPAPVTVAEEVEEEDGLYVPFDAPKPAAPPAPGPAAGQKPSVADAKREKWLKRLQQEKEVDAAEQAREAAPAPQTAEGFKLLLASNPNSSFAWCQFMAFWLARGEVAKARQVAELALQTINCREEQEIYNVWTAFLTLEEKHGTLESTHAVFRRAIQNVDQEKRLWYFMVDLMYKGEKYGRVHHMYKEMLRKFNTDVDVWAAFYRWCVKLRREDELKQIPRNALNCLSKEQHINMMTRFGGIDMKEGNVDRGRTIFEGLVAKFPKRGDVWSVYLDMEKAVMKRGKGTPKQLRALFERVTTLNLSSRAMQGFFTRYMEFEKEFGTEATQKTVHEKAVQYVEQKCGGAV